MTSRGELYRKIFCSICEHLTCDSCFVPEFTQFLQRMGKQEECILCSQPTPHRVGDSIANRSFYVEGVGQLCAACYERVKDS